METLKDTGVRHAAPRYRALDFGVTRVVLREGPGGVRYLLADQALAPYPARLTDRLIHWAQRCPDRVFLAQRARQPDGGLGDWRELRYAEALAAARQVAQALLARGLSAERPVAILSGNGIEHALLSLGCMLAGVPWCPVSPAASLVSRDFSRLRQMLGTLTPGLVFVDDLQPYRAAIAAAAPAGAEIVFASATRENGRHATQADSVETPFAAFRLTPFAELLATPASAAVDAAIAATGPDSIVKFLFTSGSVREPKAVINTHRMWCANQQQMLQSMPVLAEEPPVLVDWLPWNHTFGGNHNFGLTLYNGGTLYVDEGKPVPALVGETLRNLREIAPTVYFNVPLGFAAIADAMKCDAVLRGSLLSRVRMFFYAGASLAQPVWDSLHEIAEAEIGERIVMTAGLGMTESGPYGLFVTSPEVRAGDVGIPTPGLELKLVPAGDKTELRYRGPNVTPGYWRAPEANCEAFDEEGFFLAGDAVRWIDETNPHRGLRFDGRIAEDFKLASGTFVNVAPLRARTVAAGAPYIQDAVLTGEGRAELGALIFPSPTIRELAALPPQAPLDEVLASKPVLAHFQRVADELERAATGSATRIARMLLLAEPPSIDAGELTDKGSINQRAVRRRREALVQALHEDRAPRIIKPMSCSREEATAASQHH